MTRVLVVEDDPAAAELLTIVLQRAGHEVAVVGTGAEAIGAVERGAQLVLLDLGLPDVDGLQLCRDLRRLRPGLPLLVVSARSSEPDIVLALDAGADDYLVKPFRSRELLARMRAVLRRAEVADARIVGDLVLDSTGFTASVNGVPLALTRKEFEVLALLLRHAGRPVSRDDVLRAVWPTPLPGHSKSLDMHLSALRRKLGDASSGVTITTIRGIGFKLNA